MCYNSWGKVLKFCDPVQAEDAPGINTSLPSALQRLAPVMRFHAVLRGWNELCQDLEQFWTNNRFPEIIKYCIFIKLKNPNHVLVTSGHFWKPRVQSLRLLTPRDYVTTVKQPWWGNHYGVKRDWWWPRGKSTTSLQLGISHSDAWLWRTKTSFHVGLLHNIVATIAHLFRWSHFSNRSSTKV